ncbi:MAG: hypothetical protein LBM09_03205 [Candidatus Nomurabacteria bacterium]|jgi:hypothetical protein|nr:hypothetical protein [Candidatus Nomurabacteria bacterium]
MKLVMVYRENSEARAVAETFMREFKMQTGRDVEVVNPETRDGQNFIEVYDVVEYPTLIAIGPDGSVVDKWRGMMPTISEASAYN